MPRPSAQTPPPPVELIWTSDCALVITPVSCAQSASCARRILLAQLSTADIPGLLNLIVGATTLTAIVDPVRAVEARTAIERALRVDAPDDPSTQPHSIDIPVCYDPQYAPDLAFVAQHAGQSDSDIIRAHSNATYTVDFLGFAPGFAYLTGLPEHLAAPRMPTPRMRIPAGSVGIGGSHTGIYPFAMPGGWRIIGRTPLRLFDPNAASPALLQPADQVRFVPISPTEFERAERDGGS